MGDIAVANLVLRQSGDVTYLVNPKRRSRERIWMVNETVVAVWRLLEQGTPQALVEEQLRSLYELPEDLDVGEVSASLMAMADTDSGDEGNAAEGATSTGSVLIEKDGIPSHGVIDLTTECNLRCVHCYVRSLKAPAAPERLSLQQWKGILRQLADAGCLYLTVTGGEPLRHPDFAEIWRAAAGLGFVLNLLTNATLIDDATMALFAEYPPREVHVSAYGAQSSTYDAVTRTEGNHRRFIQALERMSDQRIPVVLKGIALAETRDELDYIRDLAERLGFSYSVLAEITPRLDRTAGPEHHRLAPAEVVECLARAGAIGRPPSSRRGNIWDCEAGRTLFHVDHLGRLGYCTQVRSPGVDLQRTSMGDAWPQLRVKAPELFGMLDGCGEDEACSYCAYCPASVKADVGEDGVPYLCRLARARRNLAEGSS